MNVSGGYDDNYAFGVGGSAGVLSRITDRWKIDLNARWLTYVLGDTHQTFTAGISQNITISRNNAIRLELSERRTYGYWNGEIRASWNHFF